MAFEPIAIVSQACVLPGALSPAALWDAVASGRDLLSNAPADYWALDTNHALGQGSDRTPTARGGYVAGFDDIFDPNGFNVEASVVRQLDPLFRWLLHCGREALSTEAAIDRSRTGAIIGNLSFPSKGFSQYCARAWLGQELADAAALPSPLAQERFMSGLPAHLLASALGLGGEAFAIDAACASSLYAIKLACDALHARRADAMLAGAVNAADDLFLHMGFSALGAISPTGRSRPFQADADGLVPAQGAALVVLKRLEDAVAAGDPILGVIRGVGLSNDGRGRGFLAPSADGQVRAMRAAYAQAEIDPSTISLLEAHATGTQVGDRTELESAATTFANNTNITLGSLKANLGHLITAAGVAGLIKVLEAMRTRTLPPMPHTDGIRDVLDATPFRVLGSAQPWSYSGPRRAAISAFGFGGNNAHLIVEAYEPQARPGSTAVAASAPPPVQRRPVAIVGAKVVQGHNRLGHVRLPVREVKFPPRDLEQTTPQQLLMLHAALEAVANAPPLPAATTGVFIGMGCDSSVARYGARWRSATWADRWQVGSPTWREQVAETFVAPLGAAGVVGTMPNVVANRLNAQFDFRGPSFAVSAEELSGIRALQVAVDMLGTGELEAAVVGAVELGTDSILTGARAQLAEPGDGLDAAVCLVLKPLAAAQEQGDRVLAVVSTHKDGEAGSVQTADAVLAGTGHAHAAQGLLALEALLATKSDVRLQVTALGGQRSHVDLAPGTHKRTEATADQQRNAANDQPMLKVSAHAPWPQVAALPGPPATIYKHWEPALGATSTTHPSTMAPAPWLPPTLSFTERGAQPLSTSSTISAQASAAPTWVATQRTAGEQLAATQSADPTYSYLAATHEQLAHAHRQHTELLTNLHKQFLQTRQQATALLLATPLTHVAGEAASTATPCPPPQHQAPPRHNNQLSVPEQVERAVVEADAAFPGPKFDRKDLIVHARGHISQLFGPAFADQDGFVRQVRMPEPPLLLADRVLGLDAQPCQLTTGSIWTETDITTGAWYLHAGRIPAGVLIEAGQADLMLISYLGIDLHNRGERVYRLLGCELTYHNELPAVGDTLRFDIHVDGHAQQGDIRLFFFHSDCHVGERAHLSVRHGQAGFFTEEELADSHGVLWDAESAPYADVPRMATPTPSCTKDKLSRAELEAFAAGDVRSCFGETFYLACTHTDTPRIASDRMLLLEKVTHIDLAGGPAGRGYLRAIDTIAADDWFFDGHFHNDPCMPGTLMFEGCLQAMAIYLTALGPTVERDGWRFEPVPGCTYKLRCRGQVTPRSKLLEYELFVDEILDGPYPTIFAHVLCTVDGLKAFQCDRLGLRLVPDWPLGRKPQLLANHTDAEPVAHADGFAFGYASLLACAWGKPSEAFGPMYTVFDGPRRLPRLPGPPYHFMSRLTRIDGELEQFKPGISVELAYDIPADAWYFEENGYATMPYCVLIEAALQPCGWLACFVGSTLQTDNDLYFRNLDGTGTVAAELLPTSGTLRTHVLLTNISRTGDIFIESFKVRCEIDGQVVYTMDTVFGFFPKEALENQRGLPTTPELEAFLAQPCDDVVDLTTDPQRYCDGTARLAKPFLRMLDRVTGMWPQAGEAGLGRYRAEKDVDPDAWFFKAHFFQDPVQPGSLGLEAMLQLLQFAMLERGMDQDLANARFEPIALHQAISWKYRGQVRPHNKLISTTLEITAVGEDERGVFAIADASLWVDGLHIYRATGFGMRLVADEVADEAANKLVAPAHFTTTFPLDPNVDTWLRDHCPTFTVPALPLMSMVDYVAQAASEGRPDQHLVGIEGMRVGRWIVVDTPLVIDATAVATEGTNALDVKLTIDNDVFASATVHFAHSWPQPPAPLPPLTGPLAANPYDTGHMFHGPAFHILEHLVLDHRGASALLRADVEHLPAGVLHPRLLDGLTHAMPQDRMQLWYPEIAADHIAYPVRIPQLSVHGPTPRSATVRCEIRPDGFAGSKHFPRVRVQFIAKNQVWIDLVLIEALFPKGPLGELDPLVRRALMRDFQFVDGVSLSTFDGDETVLLKENVKRSDWLQGTVRTVFGTDDLVSIATKEHLARKVGVHPRWLPDALPLNRFELATDSTDKGVVVRDSGPSSLDVTSIRRHWQESVGVGENAMADLLEALVVRFVRYVVVTDPPAFDHVRGRSAIYLANHQSGIESLLFTLIATGLTGVSTAALAKAEHAESWLGRLVELGLRYPGARDPKSLLFFDRDDPAALPRILAELAADMQDGKSLLVHVEGTRALAARQPVGRVSNVIIDLALHLQVPIVPVRFSGGLPIEPVGRRLDFPVHMGAQDILFGTPIDPDKLRALPYAQRPQAVCDALNAVGHRLESEAPIAGSRSFAARVAGCMREHHVSEQQAVLIEALREHASPCVETQELVAAIAEPVQAQGTPSPLSPWLAQLRAFLLGLS